ncbi:hypothetical protein [Kordia sp.]|uniref:hypothetical protein n=1 Tax=Kordia sp. TaxID=1965332 RepID=UPI003B5993E4
MKKQKVSLKKLHLSKSKVSNLASQQVVGGSFFCVSAICNATEDCKPPTDSCPTPTLNCDSFPCVSAVCESIGCTTTVGTPTLAC